MKMTITVVVDVKNAPDNIGPYLKEATEELVGGYVAEGLTQDAAQMYELPLLNFDVKMTEVEI